MLLSIVERKTSSIIYYLIFEYARDSSCLGGVHGLPHLLEKELLQQVCREGLGLGFRVSGLWHRELGRLGSGVQEQKGEG